MYTTTLAPPLGRTGKRAGAPLPGTLRDFAIPRAPWRNLRGEGGACSSKRGAVSGTLPDFRIPNFQKSHQFSTLTIGPKVSEKSIWQGPVAPGRIFCEKFSWDFSVKGEPPKEGCHIRSRFCTLRDLRHRECSFPLICGYSGAPRAKQ